MIGYVLSSIQSGLVSGSVYSLVALGLVVIYKSTKIISFTQGGLMLMGAALAWWLASVINLHIGLVIVVTLIFCMFLGLAVNQLAIRPIIGQPMLSSVMITIALAWFFDAVGILIIGASMRPFPEFIPSGSYEFWGMLVSKQHLFVFIVAVALFVAFAFFYRYTRLGLAMRGTAEDQEVVQTLGVKVTNVFAQTWMFAGLTAGIGALLLANMLNVFVGLSAIGMKGLVILLIGGLESILGVIVLGPVIGVLESLSTIYLDPIVGGGMAEIIPYVVMLLVLLFKPDGIFGLKRIERI